MDPAEITLFLSETLGGRYRPTRHLASGGFAGTFHATDGHTQTEVAAKILQLQHCGVADSIREFQDEVTMLRRLRNCDRVIDLLDSGSHTVQLQHPLSGGAIPMTTEFAILELAAGSLAELLLIGPSLRWEDRLSLYRDVVKGIHQMHLNGVVHRDVKADNSLVMERPPMAKIADLGRARDTAAPSRFPTDQYLHGRGDIRFAPLECLWLQGSEDPEEQARADLYLLGSLLFEVATGVGLTAIVVAHPSALLRRNAVLPAADRTRDWRASIPRLREAARPAHETFGLACPPVLRHRAVELLRTLTDPDPQRRTPQKRCGSRVVPTPWDLQWLLERIDGLRRTVDPTVRKAYLANRPGRVLHGRPRSRR
jgi:serine/threonine protein kinase